MDTLTRQGIEVNRQCGHQCFTLTGFHFGNSAIVQDHTTDHLYIEVAHTQYPFTGFTDYREGFGEDIVETFAVAQLLTEFIRFGLECIIIEFSILASSAAMSSTTLRSFFSTRSLRLPNILLKNLLTMISP